MVGLSEQDIDAVIAARLRALRAARHLTLDALAARSGVSRAMLSRVERRESSPTAGLLMKLCKGLGVALPTLLGDEPDRPAAALARRADQPLWRDPGSGYLRRAVSPGGTGSRVEVAEMEMPAGAAILLDALDALDRTGRDRHIWVLDGTVEVASRGEILRLAGGDCLRVASDGPIGFRNAGADVARVAVITGRAGEAG